MVDPLGALIRELDAAHPHITFRSGAPPSETDAQWIAVADLLDPTGAAMDDAVAVAITACGGAPDAAAAYLAGWLAELLAGTAYHALATRNRTWDMRPRQLWVRRRPEGWYDAVAVDGAAVHVLADDPLAGSPGVVEHDDHATMAAALAADAVAVLTPLFAALRRRAPFGTRGMWGTAADAIVAAAAHGALRDAGDERAAIGAAFDFLDQLGAAGAPSLTRPQVFTVVCRQRDVAAVRKGTCCLWYKIPPTEGTDDASAAQYCLACPLVDRGETLPRWQAWLEGELDAAMSSRRPFSSGSWS